MPVQAGSAGKIAQVVSVLTDDETTVTNDEIPTDDTIPQSDEGLEAMTLAITPTNASSTLIIQIVAMCSVSTGASVTVALFQDSGADAIAAIMETASSAAVAMPLTYKMTAGTTSATTFKVRVGMNVSGTITFNGVGGAGRFGDTPKSSIVITEVLP